MSWTTTIDVCRPISAQPGARIMTANRAVRRVKIRWTTRMEKESLRFQIGVRALRVLDRIRLEELSNRADAATDNQTAICTRAKSKLV